MKLYTDYLKWKDDLGRYETWDEAYEEIFQQHLNKYGSKISHLIDEIRPTTFNKGVLASQRNLQFRGSLIEKNNCRLYNCSVSYAYSPDIFKKGFFMLLSGAGFGINIKKRFTQKMPDVVDRGARTLTYEIPDSIEGWCDSVHTLISSFCQHPSLDSKYFKRKVRFDYSNIRPRGSHISGGFKAPGHEGLKNSLEKIEEFLSNNTGELTPYKIYYIFMHISDAVLSGGVRRSAMNVIFDFEDKEMLYAKTGNWRQDNPHFARSNNSVGLIKGKFSKEEFDNILSLNVGDNDIGFVLQTRDSQMFNPCFEISFDFYDQLENYNDTVIQMCNLTEISASYCKDKNGNLDKDLFFKQCRVGAILGTLQAGYTTFPYLGKQTEDIVSGEALLGVSITGLMDNMELFDKEILKEGARIVKQTNKEVSKLIEINQAARVTCIKPSGNASVVLRTPSGIHPEHSKQYFRIMQINKESEVAKWLEVKYPEMLEDSKWSQTKSDYVIYVPIINDDLCKTKDDLLDIDHIKLIELVQNSWVTEGTNEDLAYVSGHTHNVSNTILIDNKEAISSYIYDNQENFTAVAFLDRTGDKDYVQAPNTEVLSLEAIVDKYGEASILTSGLIVDGLHAFNGDLWEACTSLSTGSVQGYNRQLVLLQEDWIRRANKFSVNYFNGDIQKMVYCLKDIHLFHKWKNITRIFKSVPNFKDILPKPEFVNVDTLGAIACAGGSCEIR